MSENKYRNSNVFDRIMFYLFIFYFLILVWNSCALNNSGIVSNGFTKLVINIKHDQELCRDKKNPATPSTHLAELCPFVILSTEIMSAI